MTNKPKPTPDKPNGHSDWNQEDWLHSIDPLWWLPDDDKKVELNGIYELYLDLLKKGELLPNTTFEMFEKNYGDFDTDIISKLKKRIQDQNRNEGLASLFRLRGRV